MLKPTFLQERHNEYSTNTKKSNQIQLKDTHRLTFFCASQTHFDLFACVCLFVYFLFVCVSVCLSVCLFVLFIYWLIDWLIDWLIEFTLGKFSNKVNVNYSQQTTGCSTIKLLKCLYSIHINHNQLHWWVKWPNK